MNNFIFDCPALAETRLQILYEQIFGHLQEISSWSMCFYPSSMLRVGSEDVNRLNDALFLFPHGAAIDTYLLPYYKVPF